MRKKDVSKLTEQRHNRAAALISHGIVTLMTTIINLQEEAAVTTHWIYQDPDLFSDFYQGLMANDWLEHHGLLLLNSWLEVQSPYVSLTQLLERTDYTVTCYATGDAVLKRNIKLTGISNNLWYIVHVACFHSLLGLPATN